MCVATRVTFLDWNVNNTEIAEVEPDSTPSSTGKVIGPYTVFLDVVNVIPMTTEFINVTTRLVVRLSDLMIGSTVSCSRASLQESVNISYTIRGKCTRYPANISIKGGDSCEKCWWWVGRHHLTKGSCSILYRSMVYVRQKP